MLEFRLSVPNAKDIAFRIERFGVQLTDWRAAWPSVTRRLAVMLAGQFELEGGRGSRGGWLPLSPRYARRKQKRYPGRPVLRPADACGVHWSAKAPTRSRHWSQDG